MCWSPFDSVLESDKYIPRAIFGGIIGELYGNNREEIQNRILGTIMGIIGSDLHNMHLHVNYACECPV